MDKFEEEQARKEEKMLDILRHADKAVRKTTFGPTDYISIIRSYEVLAEYRAIGTLEECRKSVEICKAMIERNVTPENMEEYMKFEDECIQKDFTFDSLLEARKRMTAKKPAEKENEYGDIYAVCPNCGEHIINYLNKNVLPPHCMMCGQKIDWKVEKNEFP